MTKPKGVPSGKPSATASAPNSKPSAPPSTRSESESTAGLTSSGADVIPVQVDQQEGGGRFSMRAFLGATADDTAAPEVQPAKRGRGRPPKNPPQTIKLTSRELVEVLLVPAMLFAGKLKLPDEAKPMREEVESFLVPLCSIILRHTPPIAASADALDVVRMVFAGLHYYQRVSPILEAVKHPASQSQPEDAPYEPEAPSAGIESGNGRLHLAPELAPARTGLYTGGL